MMLLKGYGLGLNYSIPQHRPSGDIDIFLNENEGENENCGPSTGSGQALLPAWKRGDEIIRSLGIKVDSGHEHHTTFQFQGQMVENHYDIVNRYAGKSGRMEDDMFTPPHISLAATSLFAIYLIGHCS